MAYPDEINETLRKLVEVNAGMAGFTNTALEVAIDSNAKLADAKKGIGNIADILSDIHKSFIKSESDTRDILTKISSGTHSGSSKPPLIDPKKDPYIKAIDAGTSTLQLINRGVNTGITAQYAILSAILGMTKKATGLVAMSKLDTTGMLNNIEALLKTISRSTAKTTSSGDQSSSASGGPKESVGKNIKFVSLKTIQALGDIAVKMDGEARKGLYAIILNLEKLLELVDSIKVKEKNQGLKEYFHNVMDGLKTVDSFSKKKLESISAGTQKIVDIIHNLLKNVDKNTLDDFGDSLGNIGESVITLQKAMVDLVKMGTMSVLAKPLINRGIGIFQHVLDKLNTIFASRDAKKEWKEIGQGADKSIHMVRKSMFDLILIGTLGIVASPAVMAGLGIFVIVTKILHKFVKDDKEIEHGGKTMMHMALGIGATIGVLALGGLAAMKFGKMIVAGIMTVAAVSVVYALIGMESRNIKRGARAVMWMGLSLAVFSAGTAMYALGIHSMMKLNLIVPGILWLASTALVFGLTGKLHKEVLYGALSFAAMGLALYIYGKGVGSLADAIQGWTWETAAIAGAAVGVGVGLTVVLGKLFGQGIGIGELLKGPAILAATGVALWVYGWGLGKLTEATRGLTWEQAGIMASVVTGGILAALAAGATGAIGGLGAIVLAAIGGGLAMFSIGIQAMKKVLPMDDKSISSMTDMVYSLGTALIPIGLASILIIPGTLALAAMGVAINKFATGILPSIRIPWDSVPIDSMKRVIVGIAEAFAAVGSEDAGGLIGTLFTMIGLGPNKVKRGIEATLEANKALASIGLGVMQFDSFVKRLPANAFDVDPNGVPMGYSVPGKIATVVGMITSAFGSIGASGNQGTSLVKMIFGNDFKKSDVEVGIAATFKTSKALESIVRGVEAFSEFLSHYPDSAFDATNRMSIPAKIALVLSMVNKAFSEIGASANTGTSLVKLIFGGDFSESDTEQGIEAVMGAGKALTSVVQGVQAFTEFLKKYSDSDFDPTNKLSIPAKISILMGMVNKVFADIGSDGRGGFSLTKIVFGADFSRSDVDIGVNAVKGAGEAMAGIVDGILKFSRLFDSSGIILDPNNPNSIQTKILGVLGTVSDAFAKIGKGETDSGGAKFLGFITLTQGDVEKGIDIATGMGKPLEEIAKGLMKFANLQGNFPGLDIDKGNNSTVAKNIGSVITFLAGIFAEVGSKDGGFSLFGIDITEGDIQAGVESTRGIGEIVSELAEGLKTWVDLSVKGFKPTDFDPQSPGSLANNIMRIIRLTSSIFAEIGRNAVSYKNEEDDKVTLITDSDTKRGIDAMQGVGDIIEGIASGIKIFVDAMQPGKKYDINRIAEGLKSILMVSSQVFADIGKTAVDVEGNRIYPSEAVKRGVDAMEGVGDIIEGIANGLRPFMDLQKEKGIKIPVLKKHIKELVTLIADVVSGIGLNPAYDASSDESPMARGAEALKIAGEGIKNVIDFVKTLQNIDSSKLDDDKRIISTISTAPINAIREAASVYDSSGGPAVVDNIINNVFPRIQMQLESLGKLWIYLSKNVNTNQERSPIAVLADGIERYMKKIQVDVKPAHIATADAIVRFIERIANVADPYKKAVDSFTIYVEMTERLVKTVNSIQNTQFELFNKTQDKIIQLVTATERTVRSNIEMLNSYLDRLKTLTNPPPKPFGTIEEMQQAANSANSIITMWKEAHAASSEMLQLAQLAAGGAQQNQSTEPQNNVQNLRSAEILRSNQGTNTEKLLSDLLDLFSQGTAMVRARPV